MGALSTLCNTTAVLQNPKASEVQSSLDYPFGILLVQGLPKYMWHSPKKRKPEREVEARLGEQESKPNGNLQALTGTISKYKVKGQMAWDFITQSLIWLGPLVTESEGM